MNRAERPVIGARFAMPGVVYPPREALERYVRAGELPVETLAGAYLDAFERFADRLAIIGPEATLTYRQLDERIYQRRANQHEAENDELGEGTRVIHRAEDI